MKFKSAFNFKEIGFAFNTFIWLILLLLFFRWTGELIYNLRSIQIENKASIAKLSLNVSWFFMIIFIVQWNIFNIHSTHHKLESNMEIITFTINHLCAVYVGKFSVTTTTTALTTTTAATIATVKIFYIVIHTHWTHETAIK